ncbi:MAG TPA: MTH1187 family thiamine-binding protein [Syntrophorhabdaceae bacterium]|nr:MTH1187 family thiamine-binding protein [Syntrophorhabdaceae bacterium]HPU30236.1 MTH1187 family thiamine-binding protein [Syntrophorhabdaceae bacterium]
MSVLIEFAMFPTDKGESVSEYVSRIIKRIEELNLNYKLTPMGTIIEFETMDEALNLINTAYKQLETDCNRVYSIVKFDIRKGKKGRIEQKVKSIEEKLKKEVNHV